MNEVNNVPHNIDRIVAYQPSERGTPEQRFKRLAEQRVNAIVDKLRLLGQLSNKRNYRYTNAQIEKIFRTLKSELRDAQRKFDGTGKETKRFKL